VSRRRRFEPARLLAGLLFLAAAAVFAGDAAGVWDPKPVVVMGGVAAGLAVVLLVRIATALVRRGRARGVAAGE
jgi:hypothetical protein